MNKFVFTQCIMSLSLEGWMKSLKEKIESLLEDMEDTSKDLEYFVENLFQDIGEVEIIEDMFTMGTEMKWQMKYHGEDTIDFYRKDGMRKIFSITIIKGV